MKNAKGSFFTLVIILMFVSSCKKDKESIIDYREKYVGIYDFKTYHSDFDMQKNTARFDTVVFTGNVFYSDGIAKNEISVNYEPGIATTFTVDNEGVLACYNNYNFKTGKFSNDNEISFWFITGGNGGGSSINALGVKRK